MPGRLDQRAVFGPEGDVLVGFGHDGGFAGDRVADDAEAVLGADDEGVEAVEIVQPDSSAWPRLWPSFSFWLT
jgi:hypothetical protein